MSTSARLINGNDIVLQSGSSGFVSSKAHDPTHLVGIFADLAEIAAPGGC